jgi:hypothetical protein
MTADTDQALLHGSSGRKWPCVECEDSVHQLFGGSNVTFVFARLGNSETLQVPSHVFMQGRALHDADKVIDITRQGSKHCGVFLGGRHRAGTVIVGGRSGSSLPVPCALAAWYSLSCEFSFVFRLQLSAFDPRTKTAAARRLWTKKHFAGRWRALWGRGVPPGRSMPRSDFRCVQSLLWVKLRRTQYEHISSALLPNPDIARRG